MELDPGLPELHASLGMIAIFDWDWGRSGESFRRAIELDPSNTWARHGYAVLLSTLGQFDEAIEQMKQAQRLDPVAPAPTGIDQGLVYARAGDLESAAAAWQEALEMFPGDYRAHRHLGNYLCRTGNFDEGLEQLEHAASLLHDEERLQADLGYCHALAGNREKALEYLQRLEQSAKERYVDPVNLTVVHLGLGQWDQSVEQLRRGYETRAALMTEVPSDPRFDPLESDPRYQEIVRGMGLAHLLPPPLG